jgi:Protein of unknown function (DUF3987)/Primase C terminal 2 (PriCT-2)/Bifunctional DNA primase/polymerase, N-terminal
MTLPEVASLRTQLWDAGFRPLAVYNWDQKGRDGRPALTAGKAPLGNQWGENARHNPPEAVRLPPVPHALNTGILCDGLRAIDLDIDDPAIAARCKALAISMFGETCVRMRRNSARCLLVYRAAEGQPGKIVITGVSHSKDAACKIEVLGKGQQFVAFGKHPSGADLEWFPYSPADIALGSVPSVTEGDIEEYLTACADFLGALAPAPKANGHDQNPNATADHLRVAAALAGIPNVGPADWEWWNKIGMATFRATEGADFGFQAWDAWSARHPSYDAASAKERWDHYKDSPPTKIGAGTLFHLSRQPEPAEAGPPEPDPDDPGPDPDDQPQEPDWQWGKVGATGPATRWPTPLDIFRSDGAEAPILAPHHVPARLWPHIADVAIRMGVDPATVALADLVTCAAVIHDDWRLQPKVHDTEWTESARLWGCIVGPPSILKTPVISAATRIIDRLETEARREYDALMETYEAAHAAWKKAKDTDLPEPRRPKLDRYMVEGATMEAFQEVLRSDHKATQRAIAGKVLCRQDEMSEWAGNLDRYGSGKGGGGDRGAYLRMYNGGRYTIDRVARGTFAVSNWSACFLTGCQPEPIQKIAKDSAEDGLLQRFMYVVPGPPGEGLDQVPNTAAIDAYYQTVRALSVMRPNARDFGVEHLVFHRLAHVHREEIDRAAKAMIMMPDTSNRVKATLGKWPGLFARLCLTFHMIESAGTDEGFSYVVPEETAERVKDFMLDIVLPHMMRADSAMFLTPQTGHARWIAGHILAHELDVISTRIIKQAYRALRPSEMDRELHSTLTGLVSIGWLDPVAPKNPLQPITSWRVNPEVHTRFAGKAKEERDTREGIMRTIKANATRYPSIGFGQGDE